MNDYCRTSVSSTEFSYFDFSHRYASGSARSDGMFLLCGGRDTLGVVYFLSPLISCADTSRLLFSRIGL